MSEKKGRFNHDRPKWIVLDTEMDAIRMENLNTVADDNKLLCLANGEKIPMTSEMRIICECTSVEKSSPATISRFGIVAVGLEKSDKHPQVQKWLK